MTRIAVLASGSGTNAENIVRYFAGHPTVKVATVIISRHSPQVGGYFLHFTQSKESSL